MSNRPVQPMPDDVQQELEGRGLIDAYGQHPFYQRNDYLSWISRAKRIDTRRRRIEQMLEELEEGGVYMGMDHPPSRKTRRLTRSQDSRPGGAIMGRVDLESRDSG